MAKGIYQEWLKSENIVLLRGWKRKGLSDEQIAKNIGVNVRTLSKWKAKYGQIGHALKTGKEHANFIVENALMKRALEGNVTAQIFWLKNNYREKYSEYSTGDDHEATKRLSEREKEVDIEIKQRKLDMLKGASNDAMDSVSELIDKIDGTFRKDDSK